MKTTLDISIDIKAAGIAENNIYAHESGYTNIISGAGVVGVAPEFEYTEGLAVDEVTFKDSTAVNTLGEYTESSDEFVGIKRLNVFKYFEDINMLLLTSTYLLVMHLSI